MLIKKKKQKKEPNSKLEIVEHKQNKQQLKKINQK